MWKKNDPEDTASETPQTQQRTSTPPARTESSVLGPSLVVKGDITGTQDLVIGGQVEGTVNMKDNTVTVAESGQVKADIYGRSVIVEGDLRGNLFGGEKIIVKASGRVRGNISAPRVTLEDGARFKGSIDMEGSKEEKKVPAVAKPATPGPKTESVGSDAATPVAGLKKAEKTGGQLGINAPSTNR